MYIYWCIAINYDDSNSKEADDILLSSFALICNIINFVTLGLILIAIAKVKTLIKRHPQLTEANFMMCIHLTLFISFEIAGTIDTVGLFHQIRGFNS
jgi:hypothetical protein